MTGSAIDITIDDHEVRDLFRRVLAHLGDMTPAMQVTGEIVRTSVVRNFELGGRPAPWKPLSETTLARRKKGGGILRVQGNAGGLMGSISYEAYPDHVLVGTNKIYGAVHQFGATKGEFGTIAVTVREHLRKGKTVREHTRSMAIPWGDIPARPYLMVQDEDWDEIRAALGDFLTEE